MNIMAKLTLKHLLENKKRTVITIIGVAMSVALISSIFMGVASFFEFIADISIKTSGNTHAAFYEVTGEQADALKADDRIALAGVKDNNNKISGIRLSSDLEERFVVGNILHADEDFYKEVVNSGYEGTLPANSSEVAVNKSYLEKNGLNLNVGDTISFEQGNRYYIDEDGKVIYYGGEYRSNEQFEKISDEQCRITAIISENRPTSDYDMLRGMDKGFFPEKKDAEVRICLKKCDHTAAEEIRKIAAEYGIAKIEINQEYLIGKFAIDKKSSSFAAFFRVLGAALFIAVLTAIILMVNSFGMSLAEKMRYLGMLASVGATGKQKRFSVFFEGLILAVVGIPIGMFIGYMGTKLTLSVLGRAILEADMIVGAEGMRGSIPVVCTPLVILLSVGLSAVTVFVSSLIPAIKAAKVMPVDAIRQTGTIRIKSKKLKVNPLIRAVFGYEGELAYKNIKRNGIKAFIITTSIAVSVIMFLTITFFCDSAERANKFDFELPYQVVVSCSYEEKDKLRQVLADMEGVDKVFSCGMITYNYKENKEEPDAPIANKKILNKDFLTSAYSELDIDMIYLCITDDEDFRALLTQNGLSEDKYFGDNLKGVLLNNYFHEEGTEPIFNDRILGERIFYDAEEGNPPAVEVSDFVGYDKNSYIFKIVPKGTVAVYVPESIFYAKDIELIPKDELTCDFGVVTKDSKEVSDKIFAMLEEDGYHNYTCSDLTDSLNVMKTVTLILKTAMYGFTVLLTLIAVANIVNTISTGVLLRRKEFAMYKSVGMAQGGFKKMIFLETVFYGLKALMAGLPISVILSYLMYRALDIKIYSFDLDIMTYVLVVVVVFVVVSISMILGLNKIKDDSIIEALKEDVV